MKKILIILLGIVLATGCGCKKKESFNIKIEDELIDGIEISDINISYENNVSTCTAIVTNTLEESKYVGIIDIIFIDKDNNEIVTLKGLVNKVLLPHNSIIINTSVDIDLSNYKKVEYKI